MKHLDFIQLTITRLAANSFLLKAWSVTIVAGLFALSANAASKIFIFIAFLPAVIFWGLDGYYLHEEKKYRSLYDTVRLKNEDDIDFSMDNSRFASDKNSWFRSTFSKTLVPFYGGVVAVLIVIMMIGV